MEVDPVAVVKVASESRASGTDVHLALDSHNMAESNIAVAYTAVLASVLAVVPTVAVGVVVAVEPEIAIVVANVVAVAGVHVLAGATANVGAIGLEVWIEG